MTRLLFYDRPRATQFTAQVKQTRRTDRGWEVVLDQTGFYPEGGGQPADRGTLNGIEVVHVTKADGDVTHLLRRRPDTHEVVGVVDWQHRFHFMQQHSGQHLISAALKGLFDFNTVSVHLGSVNTTVEIDASEMSDGQCEAVEARVNAAIRDDLPVTPVWTQAQELDSFSLRRPTEVKGDIRIIKIGDFDCVACGGLHVARTGEIGLVKWVGGEKIRQRVRTVWKIGQAAYEDYGLKHRVVTELVAALSAQPPDLPYALHTLQKHHEHLTHQLRLLETRLAAAWSEKLVAGADRHGCLLVITHTFRDESPSLMRHISEALSEVDGVAACLLNLLEDRILWYLCVGPRVSVDMPGVKDALMPIMDGKGGGTPPIWQGMGRSRDAADEVLREFARRVLKTH